MTIALATNWWSPVLRGLIAILVGVATFIAPGMTLTALVLLFGCYALVDGLLNIAGAVRSARAGERWGALVFEGVVGIAAGLVAIAWPAITALALVYVIAAWALLTGILELAVAIRLRKHVGGEWFLVLGGIASVAFGLVLMIAPLAGALVITLWVGVYALIFGILMVALGFRLRNWGKTGLTGTRPSIPIPAH